MSEKSQPPTPKKIKDERAKGRVAKSADLAVCIQLGVVLVWLTFEGPVLYQSMEALVSRMLLVLNDPVDDAVRGMAGPSLLVLARFGGGLALLLIVTTWLTMVIQVGAIVAPEAIRPKYERVDPIAKAKQLFSMQSLFEFGKSLLKVGVLGMVFFYLIRQYTPSLAALPQCGPACGIALTAKLLFWLMAVLVVAYVVFGGLDLAYQKYQLHKQLRMSHDEIKRESKEVEGDRDIKNKRRDIHRETIESGSLSNNVKRSTAVVRNPTHIAVCLRYVPGETPVPLVIEKGRNARARTIVRLAEREGVPVVEHVPVARRLMNDVEIDAPVPTDLFDAVAAILRLALDLPYEVQVEREEQEEPDEPDEQDERNVDPALVDNPGERGTGDPSKLADEGRRS
ncbi:EscU/YscU/HrcU family type III secretion system export apparatus switch protein [Pandoraea apista]|uniref:EscU/YscU/HrcU family type III secretion system export apparatus switch protein n=1 Tax=Pandoraea apista TaxID=93218 RepID=UPI000658E119|nr:EscU/YscU/HrcU family type III secretion system export apparatus switch protein [Pandoraea apista]RRW90663.1 EscU/YscU/HrcU family type III secretion system export apparatus switch protein [Pandoraea apista]RRX00454.1 EscU/YscU/HrcU family type III secretion system export apparatus switch protein [Pandoraea apista]CFB62677.1 Yop proteins translocation protein U [Pandoraea apista]